MDSWSIIADVVLLLAGASALGVIFERAGQSALVGYLLAGIVLGPGVLGIVGDTGAIGDFAELGVALLLFAIGLEFSSARLRALGLVALLGGALQLILTAALMTVAGALLGLSWQTSLAVGLVIGPSSTACVLRLLQQRTELETVHGRTSIGILLLQDVALVPLVVGMTVLGSSAQGGTVMPKLASTVVLGTGFVAALYLTAKYVLPRIIDAAALSKNRELPLLLAITTCLASAWGAHALHLSPVLGAFVAGVLLAESPYATWIRADISALRTLFLTLFFASIAMIDDLGWIAKHWNWVALAVPILLAGKALVVLLVVKFWRIPVRMGLAAGLCLAQTGEFSFVLAKIGHESGVITEPLFRLLIATTVLSLIATPYLVQVAARVASSQSRRTDPAKARTRREDQGLQDHVIIVGLGPAGTAVYEAISGFLDTAVIDMNSRAATLVKPRPAHFIAGDATHESVLHHAGVEHARAVVVTIPHHETVRQVVRLARQLAPPVKILARARYHRFAGGLMNEANIIADEETLTGQAMAAALRRTLELPPQESGPEA